MNNQVANISHKTQKLLQAYCSPKIQQDPHLREILNAIDLIVTNHKQEQQKSSYNFMHNLIYNSQNEYGIHPEMIIADLSGDQSAIILHNTLVYDKDFLIAKYITHYYNLKIQKFIFQNNSLVIKLELLDKEIYKYNIRFFTDYRVLKNLFSTQVNIDCLIQQNGENINGTASIDCYDWTDLAYSHQNLQSFSVSFTLPVISNNITICLFTQEPMALINAPLTTNKIILENRFLWLSNNIDINGPGKYVIRVPKKYRILKIRQLVVDDNIILPIAQNIKGWYVYVEKNKIILHINDNSQGIGVLELEVASRDFSLQNPYFVEANGCTISINDLCSDFYSIEREESLFWFHILNQNQYNLKYLLQILKLYSNCSHYQFNIISEKPVIVPSGIQRAIPIVKYDVHIATNCPYVNLLHSISFYFQNKYQITWVHKQHTFNKHSKIIEII